MQKGFCKDLSLLSFSVFSAGFSWLHVGPVSSAPSSLAALLCSPPKEQGPKRIKKRLIVLEFGTN